MNRLTAASLLLLSCTLNACGAATEWDEDFDSEAADSDLLQGAESEDLAIEEATQSGQALAVEECRDAAPTLTTNGVLVVQVPGGYDDAGCFKAKVMRANNTVWDIQHAKYDDTLPTTKASCEATSLRVIAYERSGSNWINAKDQKVFGTFASGACTLPVINHFITDGKDYKYAVSARNSSGNTRQFRMWGTVVR